MANTMTLPNKTERRAIVDTHRHPCGAKMQAKMAEAGLFDPKQGFPQTNAHRRNSRRKPRRQLGFSEPLRRCHLESSAGSIWPSYGQKIEPAEPVYTARA